MQRSDLVMWIRLAAAVAMPVLYVIAELTLGSSR